MTPAAARAEHCPPRVAAAGGQRLARLSGLLGLVAVACLVRLGLLAGALDMVGSAAPVPPDGAAPVIAPVEAFGSGPISSLAELPEADRISVVAVAPAAGPVAQPSTPRETPGVAEGVLSPKALLAVAAELKGRRELVERRERELETREAALDLVEERLAAQIERLEDLKGDLESVLGRIGADEQARLDQLAKVYEAMKAKKAASIFDAMGLDLLLPVVRRMRDSKVSAVIAEMDPAKARLLTAELARAKVLPTLPQPATPGGQ